MTVVLNPGDEALIEQQMKKGDYKAPADVIHLALEYLAQSEDWLLEINQAIKEGLDQAEQGELHSPEESLRLLEFKKAEWRASRSQKGPVSSVKLNT